MTLGERIKKVRKSNDLTQPLFAEKIGSTQNVLANYETGRRNPSSSVINNICKTFNVREEWLRTGEGEMFIKKEPQPLDKLLSELLGEETVTVEDRTLVKNFLELPDASRKAVIEFVQKCSGELSATVIDAKSETTTRTAPDLAAKVAELERQNQELAAKVAAMEEEDIARGLWDGSPTLPPASAG